MAKNSNLKFDRDPGLVLYSWKRAKRKRVICSKAEGYGGRFHFREWILNSDGAYYPTRSGITLSISELKELRRGLKKAIEISEED